MKIAVSAVAASGCLSLLVGCGLAANPQPPTLWLPQPVKNLTANREGDEVHLHWSMPRDSTDKLRLKGPQRAHVCWMPPGKLPFDAKNCTLAGDSEFPPNKPADFIATIPPDLTSGTTRAVSYFVELQNPAGKSAGPSNPAWVAAGPAPPPLTGLRLETRPEGVVLHWEPAPPAPSLVLRIHRMLVVQQQGASKVAQSSGGPPPEQQTLEVNLNKSDPGEALDRDAPLNHIWRYTAERVLRVEADHRALDVGGRPAGPVTIDAKDIFPPAVPAGLAAVPDEQAHAIDLSWTPDSEADLAGYIVYRRDVTAGTGLERVSPTLVVPPSFHDTQVQAGHRYAYAVSAVDQDGNESARSSETEEQLPQ